MNAFVAYVGAHANQTFYAQPAFAQEAQDISGYAYLNQIRPIFNCSASSLARMPDGYFVLGGTLSISWAPEIMDSYDRCVAANLTNAKTVFYSPSPLTPGSPLVIVRAAGGIR
ncbi:Uncharacterised protein [uncultured archaeon]|nr:Uncharacterised protein [uncultured archaeon]